MSPDGSPDSRPYWRGVAHAHSKYSFDAKRSYQQIRDFLSSKGLHFVCMTEHIEGLDQRTIDRIIATCRDHSDNRFLFVPGIEMDYFVVYFLGIRGPVAGFTDNQTIFATLRRNAAMLVLSHPIKSDFAYPDWLSDTCDAVEVHNSKHDGHHYIRTESEQLFQRLRARRPDVVGLAGLDFHDYAHYSPIHMRLSLRGPLTEDFVLTALRQGHFAIYKGEIPLAAVGAARRVWLRSRIRLMDLSHATNRLLQRAGLRVPRSIRKVLAAVLER